MVCLSVFVLAQKGISNLHLCHLWNPGEMSRISDDGQNVWRFDIANTCETPIVDSVHKLHKVNTVSQILPGLFATSRASVSMNLQCLKLKVAQSPLATKNWAGPVKSDPGQVKIIIDYIRREFFWTFLGDLEKILVWNTEPSVRMSSHTVSLLMKIRNEANLSF